MRNHKGKPAKNRESVRRFFLCFTPSNRVSILFLNTLSSWIFSYQKSRKSNLGLALKLNMFKTRSKKALAFFSPSKLKKKCTLALFSFFDFSIKQRGTFSGVGLGVSVQSTTSLALVFSSAVKKEPNKQEECLLTPPLAGSAPPGWPDYRLSVITPNPEVCRSWGAD